MPVRRGRGAGNRSPYSACPLARPEPLVRASPHCGDLHACYACMHNACMVALQIRDVPDEVREILAARAQQLGQSLQAYLLRLVTDEASRANNIALLRTFESRTDGADSSMEDTVAEIEAARTERAW